MFMFRSEGEEFKHHLWHQHSAKTQVSVHITALLICVPYVLDTQACISAVQ